LLRVLEENEVRPVGGTRVRRVDMRFIAATNRDLEARVRDGAFRKDLYYRLAVMHIAVPPLRERREDVRVLARHLLGKLSREFDRPRCHFDEVALTTLTAYHWPGNGRELRNVIERAIMLATGDTITEPDVQALLPKHPGDSHDASLQQALASLPYMEAKERAIEHFTKAYLEAKLAQYEGVITKAAESSGIPRQHFSLLMKRFLGSQSSSEE
jgi:DNA-binding NtrC family response regulator